MWKRFYKLRGKVSLRVCVGSGMGTCTQRWKKHKMSSRGHEDYTSTEKAETMKFRNGQN